MSAQASTLSVPVPPATRRLLLGLLVSFVVHLAVVLTMATGPGPAHIIASRPLEVEIRAANPPPQRESAASIAMENPGAELSAAVEPPAAPAQEPLAPTPPRRESAAVELPFDRYFTSGELDTRAEQINDVDLVYPIRAYQMRIRGKVVLRMYINERGGLDEVTILDSAPPGVFEEAALSATLALQFRPAMKNGRDVKSQKTIEVIFDPYVSINIP